MNRKGKKERFNKIFRGVVDVTNSGYAFVIVKELDKDILILECNLSGAIHRDLVEVQQISVKKNRVYGKVIKIIKRQQNRIIGGLLYKNKIRYFIPNSSYRIKKVFSIDNLDHFKNLDEKSKVVVSIIDNKKDVVEIVEVFNKENEDSLILQDVLLQFNFQHSFSGDVLNYCKNFKKNFSTEEIKNRKDFRGHITFTIDPINAKDFDDAISLKFLINGNVEIGIHIADVSHFVKENTQLDNEACQKATSVYMPGFVSPMLPEILSNDLCSLVPKKDRLCFATIFELNICKEEIKIVDVSFGKTVINSNKRFTYEEVQEIIEKKRGKYKDEILKLHEIAQILKHGRTKNGSINFSSLEVNFVLDDNNFPTGIKIKESREAHQLIEEFMLLANKEVARFLNKFSIKGIFFPFRVHDKPDESKIDILSQFIRKFGFNINTSNKKLLASSMNAFLERVKENPEYAFMEKLAIRTMAKAQYSTKNIGHYGLGFDFYTHFTSPIRRYADILVHRALYCALNLGANKKHKKRSILEENCSNCNQKERDAVDAERLAIKYKQVQFMSKHIYQDFEAVITGVSSFGIWSETIIHKCEGMIKMSDLLLIDDFVLVPNDFCLIGKRKNIILSIGQKITISVISAKIEEKELDFKLVM